MSAAAVKGAGRHDALFVTLVTLAGATLRLSTLGTRGLWLDETLSVQQASLPLSGVINVVANNVHPPLFHVLLHYWLLVFGTSVWSVRTFSSSWGILAIPLAFWVGRITYGRRTGLIAATIVAMSPFGVWYSQEARMYSMMMVFSLLSVGFMALAVRDRRGWQWAAYGVFTLAGMFTHYFFIFLLIGEMFYIVAIEVVARQVQLRRRGKATLRWYRPFSIFRDSPALGPWLLANVLMGGGMMLWLAYSVFSPGQNPQNSILASLAGSGLGYGQPTASLAWRLDSVSLVFAEMTLGFHPPFAMYAFVAMWPLGISATLIGMTYWRKVAWKSALVPFAASGGLLIAAIGQWQGSVLASRYFIAVAAPSAIVVAALLARVPSRMLKSLAIVGVCLSIVLWADQSFNPANIMRYDDAQVINLIADQYRPGDTVISEPFFEAPVFGYYMPRTVPWYSFPEYGLSGQGLRNGKALIGQDLARVVNPTGKVWLFLGFQDSPVIRGDAYNTEKWFERNGFAVEQNLRFNKVQLIEYRPVSAANATGSPLGAP